MAVLVVILALVVGGAVFAYAESSGGGRRVVIVRPATQNTLTQVPQQAQGVPAGGADGGGSNHPQDQPAPAPAGASATTGGSLLKVGSQAAFAPLAAEGVQVALAPVGSGHTVTLGGDTPSHAWSTSKVPVLVSLLASRRGRGLTAREQSLAQSAITQSDNQAILALFSDLEQETGGLTGASQYIDSVLQQAGDDQTTVATAPPPPGAVTTFGQTEWSPLAQVKFMRALARGCLLSSGETSYVLGLMSNIVPGESWGLGSAGFSHVAFKGGWGPDTTGGYVVRQTGIIDAGTDHAVAVAVLVPGQTGGSFDSGVSKLNQAASWLRGHLRMTSHPQVSC